MVGVGGAGISWALCDAAVPVEATVEAQLHQASAEAGTCRAAGTWTSRFGDLGVTVVATRRLGDIEAAAGCSGCRKQS